TSVIAARTHAREAKWRATLETTPPLHFAYECIPHADCGRAGAPAAPSARSVVDERRAHAREAKWRAPLETAPPLHFAYACILHTDRLRRCLPAGADVTRRGPPPSTLVRRAVERHLERGHGCEALAAPHARAGAAREV